MKEKLEVIRKKALPWNGESAVAFYLEAHPSFPYREQFTKLFIEAYHAYLAGYPRASIVIAGEALLRAIYDQIIRLVATSRSITILITGGRSTSFGNETPLDALNQLGDKSSFYKAVKTLQGLNIYSSDTINQMFVVKELRNRAVHSDLPILDDWDLDELRTPEKLQEILLDPNFDFLEGYRFLRKDNSDWFRIDLQKYRCVSLKPLGWEDRFASIQYLLVLEVISKMKDSLELDNVLDKTECNSKY